MSKKKSTSKSNLEMRISDVKKALGNLNKGDDIVAYSFLEEDLEILIGLEATLAANGFLGTEELRELEDVENYHLQYGALAPTNNSEADTYPSDQGYASIDNKPSYGPQGELGFAGFTSKTCVHTGDKEFQLPVNGGTAIIAGARGHSVTVGDADIIFDLAGLVSQAKTFVSGSERFAALNDYALKSEVVRMHWADRGIPPVGLDFWLKIVSMIKPQQKAIFACIGSHGRTGTALAAMLMAAVPTLTAEAAIKFIRKEHCSNAIETSGQERYLERLEKERKAPAQKSGK